MSTLRTSLFALAAAALSACVAPGSAGDLAFEGDAQDLGKADLLRTEVELVALDAAIAPAQIDGAEHAIFTSPASFEGFFAAAAPIEIDWSREWVAYYSAGAQRSGGFDASITSVAHLPEVGGLVLGSHLSAPGPDCLVPSVITTPHALVKFEVPADAPTWFATDHSEKTRRCTPTD